MNKTPPPSYDSMIVEVCQITAFGNILANKILFFVISPMDSIIYIRFKANIELKTYYILSMLCNFER